MFPKRLFYCLATLVLAADAHAQLRYDSPRMFERDGGVFDLNRDRSRIHRDRSVRPAGYDDANWRRFPDYVRPTSRQTPLRDLPPLRVDPIPKPRQESNTYREELDKIRKRVAYRWSNPVSIRFAQGLDVRRGLALFREVNAKIDARHIRPASYAVRVRRALLNLMIAVESAEFRRATGLRMDQRQVQAFQQSLGYLNRQTVRSNEEAGRVLYSAITLTERTLRLRSGYVVLEFVSGAAEALDEYSGFEPKSDRSATVKNLRRMANLHKQMVGIGVDIKAAADGMQIIRVLPGGPAARAGIRKDDMIVSINGRPMARQNVNFAVDQISGPEGTRVMLGVRRDGRRATLVTLTRSRFNVLTVSDVRMLSRDVGYLKLHRFSESSVQEVENAVRDLYRRGMKTLVFDVRGNPGGLLTTAIKMCDRFLPCGTIVSTRGRTQSDNSREQATHRGTWSVPIVVLIDKDSASASEIFAAAIQDNRRGIVVGAKSYGKGTVQTHFPMQSVTGTLRLTTANFYSPSGRVMSKRGVSPDVATSRVRVSGYRGTGDATLSLGLQMAERNEVKQMARDAQRCGQPGYRSPLLSRAW